MASICLGLNVLNVHHQVSMVARIVPSPDWFVGVSSLNLCEEGVWVDHLTFDLAPMDAGTDKGMTFSAPNWAEDPQLPITVITSQVSCGRLQWRHMQITDSCFFQQFV